MLPDNGKEAKRPHRKLEEVSENVVSALKSIDESIEQRLGSQPNCRALQPIPHFSSVLLVDYTIRDRLGSDIRFAAYDYVPVLISELGVVRSIRFSGKTENIYFRNSFKIERLKRFKGESARIAEEVPGTFVTLGKIEFTNLSDLQLYVGALMGLIRPYAKILAKDSFAIIPSPLSLCAFRYLYGGAFEHVWLSPSTVTVRLSSESARVTKMNILGKWIEAVVTEGHMISCKTDAFNVSLLEVGPFPIVLPLSQDFLSDIHPLISSLKYKDLIVYLAGIFVFKGAPYMRDIRTASEDGYFLALSELPIPLDVEIAAVTGEPWKIEMKGSRERSIFPSLKSEKDLFDTTRKEFLNKIRKIRINFKANDLLQSQTIGGSLSSLNEFFISYEYFIYYLSPPLITTVILDNISTSEIYEIIMNIIWAIHKARSNTDLELVLLSRNNKIFKKIIDLRTHTEVWSRAYSIHRSLAEKFNLGYVM